MLTRKKTIKLLHDKHPFLATEFGVNRIGLFGSFAKGQPDKSSDVDLVLEFSRPIGFRFMELVDYLESLLGRRVDVLTPAGVQNIRVGPVTKNIARSIVYV